GNAEDARRLARMALGTGGLDWRPYLVMAEAAVKSNNSCDAWAYFGKVLEIAPTNARAAEGQRLAEKNPSPPIQRPGPPGHSVEAMPSALSATSRGCRRSPTPR